MAGDMSQFSQTLIGQAIAKNKISLLKEYIADGEDPLYKDRKGNTYVHYVCTMYRPFIFQILLASGIDINARNKHGYTALHVTALQVECCHVGDLMAAGIDPYIKDNVGKTAEEMKTQNKYWHTIFNIWQPGLYNTIKHHNVPRMLELLHNWSKINCTYLNKRQTLRQFAASLKHHDIVGILDAHECSLDLIYGVLEVDYEKVEKALKKSKCNVNFLNKASNRPHILQHAMELQDLTLVSMLCGAGADVNIPIQVHKYYWGPLYFESINTKIRPSIMWKILESGPDFNLKDQRGRTALTFALDKNNGRIPLDVMEFLLNKGTCVTERDETGATIRDVARFSRRLDIVDLIDKWYVNILRRSDMDMLYQLAMEGYDSCFITYNYRDSYIYACGNETDDVLKFFKWLPRFQTSVQSFHTLVVSGNLDKVTEVLKKHDKPKLLINSKDKGGRAPLHIAVLWNRPEIVEFLLTCPDLNIDVKDCCCRTAYHYVCGLHDDGEEIREMLLRHGVDQCIVDTKYKKAREYLDELKEDQWIEKERQAKYGMELELYCIDKYEELFKIISNKKKGLQHFNEKIKNLRFPVIKFSSVLDPVMPNFKDLLFLAVDCRKADIARNLANLGSDLTRTEMYRSEDNPIPEIWIKLSTSDGNVERSPKSNVSSLTDSVRFTISSLDCIAEVPQTAEDRARKLEMFELADCFAKKLKRQKQMAFMMI